MSATFAYQTRNCHGWHKTELSPDPGSTFHLYLIECLKSMVRGSASIRVIREQKSRIMTTQGFNCIIIIITYDFENCLLHGPISINIPDNKATKYPQVRGYLHQKNPIIAYVQYKYMYRSYHRWLSKLSPLTSCDYSQISPSSQ